MAAVLITGCSSGIGLETALAFARRGDHTYASMRNPEKAARLRERAAAENLEVEVLALDVTDDASVAAAVQLVEERHGAVDVLVNNAGITYAGAIEVTPIEQARAVMETNFWGVLRTIRAALPAMRARGGGVIVNVSSLAGRVWSVPYGGFYSASKAGIGSLSEALAGEVEQFGVRVVCIEPGSFATDVQTNAFNRELSEEDPYSADEAWLTRFMVRIAEAGGEPAVVADAIVAAVENPDTPLHALVGEEAEMAVDLAGKAGYEQWYPQFVQQAEHFAGPRPVKPVKPT
ncbi:SDR family oxidoreductase [Kitasatospora kifunensis]|uniref:NAD(P)-dependent dehydrogenase (Short-subunit alcohol dehydrogenase family) n=1 Tax=Kitasatospora kifunensis TaxID=58351 RepID=A0A7W7VTM4_KITKI|nr:SDR family oxidoreductase [Kitasatospora kifunensis]MBB4921570.1 NAD(P)-dependent dehydrogenase (short-subunit alcohol dehydrogenase family) [Kitasatospora kifunensis]